MPGRLLHALFIRIYGACAYFSGNDETEVLEKVKIFVKPPIRQKSHTALPTQCAVSRSTLSSESKAHLAKVLSGFASTMRARSFKMALAPALPGQSSRVVSFD
jgi:hypothetical protein